MRIQFRATTVVAAVAAAASLASAAPAFADSGDGNANCNPGEICFSRSYPANNYQKHFFQAANHGSYSWFDTKTGRDSGISMLNDAAAVKNRDTKCWVKVVDDRGPLPDNYQWIANDNKWIQLNGETHNKNDRHERC